MAAIDAVSIIVLLAFVIMAAFGVYAGRYKKVPPDKAMVVYGKRQAGTKKGYRVISGGAKFIVPVLESYEFLPLDVRTLDVVVNDIVTDVIQSGAKINIKCVTQVKISSDPRILDTAAEQLLHKTNAEINEIALKTLEGHVRGVCAVMTIEDINSDRDMIAGKVQTYADKDLKNMGIEIRSFVIKEIEDEHGYLDALGIKRTEEVKRDARIGKAVANREATIQEARAAQEGEKANADAEAQVALYHRDRDITRQKAEAEVEMERANKEISFEIQDAKRRQELVVEQRIVDIRDKEKRVEVQRQEVFRKEQEQKAEQVVPASARADAIAAEADGEKRKQVTLAEGEKGRLILTAEGQKQNLSLTADGQSDKIRKEGTAEADIIRLKGEAEADAIRAKGLAEAEAMEKKAAAWEKYGRAAVTELIVEKLPEIVGEASRAIQNTEKIIVMGEGGPSSLVKSAVDIAAQAPTLVKALTGMELGDLAIKLKELQR
jgi:flotillin